MSAAGTVTCPKCAYARTSTETAPAWQCPSCGIAYIKFQAGVRGAQQGIVSPAAGAVPDKRAQKISRHVGHNQVETFFTFFSLALLATGCFAPIERIWLWVLPALAANSLVFWIWSYRIKRAVLDVPTSRVGSAAQGYVELHGKVAYLPGCTLRAPLTNAPCIWYDYMVVEHNGGNNSRKLEGHDFGTPFILRDDTGDCLVDLDEALVICGLYEQWSKGDRGYSEWSIRVGDPIYAIGWFSSNALHADGSTRKEANVKLRSWLRDPKDFFRRFDANRDGKISTEELDDAHAAAHREAEQYYASQGGMHTMTAPPDQRRFIVSNLPHDKVAGEFGSLSQANLWVFFIALGFWAYNVFN